MQMAVVAATMPSLVLLSRTRFYAGGRVAGATFAGVAATGWIAERALRVHAGVDGAVGLLAAKAVWIAAGLLMISGVAWVLERIGSVRIGRACSVGVREV
jgi:hypothetical protein